MDRLTIRFSNGTAGLIMSKMPRLAPYANAITRLAAYEDTGLEPEIIRKWSGYIAFAEDTSQERLIELADAEKEGRLIALPSNPYEMADVAQEILSRACSLQREAEGGDDHADASD